MTSLDVGTALRITPLSRDDGEVVRRWLAIYLRQHNRAWAASRGLGWSDGEVDAQMLGADLVSDHWQRLVRASRRDADVVRVARLGDRAIGCVWAAERVDDYLRTPSGVLNWVFVDTWARQHGVASALVGHAKDWMRHRGLRSVVVSVLADNDAARRLYAREGLAPADLRMMGPLGSGERDGAT